MRMRRLLGEWRHVCETLLGYAKDGRLRLGGQATVQRGFHSHGDLAALRKFFEYQRRSGSQAEVQREGGSRRCDRYDIGRC